MSDPKRAELLGMSAYELSEWCGSVGLPTFRGKQLADWIYRRSAHSFDEMANLPRAMRGQIQEQCTLTRSKVIEQSTAPDGTTKHLHQLADGETIESVFLPYSDRASICVSTQVGCPVRCSFCATGMSGFKRNLTRGEIVDQVLTAQELHQRRVTHIVFMGMGEPLLNLDETLAAIGLINTELGISSRRITVSTVGIVPAIAKIAEVAPQVTLAVSLHAPTDELRARLIPFAANHPLAEIIRACMRHADSTGRRTTFEYLMISDVNDRPEHARQLAALLKHTASHVNLIPCNPVQGLAYRRSTGKSFANFKAILEQCGITVTQRLEKGASRSAACGQLRSRSTLPGEQ